MFLFIFNIFLLIQTQLTSLSKVQRKWNESFNTPSCFKQPSSLISFSTNLTLSFSDHDLRCQRKWAQRAPNFLNLIWKYQDQTLPGNCQEEQLERNIQILTCQKVPGRWRRNWSGESEIQPRLYQDDKESVLEIGFTLKDYMTFALDEILSSLQKIQNFNFLIWICWK